MQQSMYVRVMICSIYAYVGLRARITRTFIYVGFTEQPGESSCTGTGEHVKLRLIAEPSV